MQNCADIAPTTACDNRTRDEFYNVLHDTLESIPAHDVIIVMGDANSKVGKQTMNPAHTVFYDLENKMTAENDS